MIYAIVIYLIIGAVGSYISLRGPNCFSATHWIGNVICAITAYATGTLLWPLWGLVILYSLWESCERKRKAEKGAVQ